MASVREQIVAAVAAALEDVNLNNGEDSPDQIVQQVLREYNSPDLQDEIPVIWVLDTRESKQVAQGGGLGATFRNYLAELNITILIVDSAGVDIRDEPMSVTANRMLAATEKALYDEIIPDTGTIKQIPGVNWVHTVGNRMVPFGETGNLVLVTLDVVVQYIHRDTDPNIGRV